MRELEASLQQFREFLLKGQLVRQRAAPHVVRWVRRFLSRQASDESLADLRSAGFATTWNATVGSRTGKSAKPSRHSASTSSTSPRDRIGFGGQQARWWTSTAGRGRWRRWNTCASASERDPIPIERSAPTQTGGGASWTISSSRRAFAL